MGVPAVIERAIDDAMPTLANILAATPGLPANSFKAAMLSQMQNHRAAEKLARCTLPSILNCAATFAGLGLMPDGVSQQAFMLPFKDTATPVVGKQGYVTLGDRAGRTIKGNVVREGDEFDYMEGSTEYVKHKRLAPLGSRITHAWAVMTAPNRTPVVQVVPIDQLIEIMKKSPAVKFGSDTPYNDLVIGRPAMFEKSAVRKLRTSIPLVQGGQFLVADHVEGRFEQTERPHYLLPGQDGRLRVTDGVTGEVHDIKPPTGEDPTLTVKLKAALNAGEPPSEFERVGEWRGALMRLIDVIGPRKTALERFREANAVFLAEASSLGGDYQDAAMQVGEAIAKALASAK